MNQATKAIRTTVLEELHKTPGLKAAELAERLGIERQIVNRCLAYELKGKVQQGSDYRWRLVQARHAEPPMQPSVATTEIARLSKYYLECIGQDMDEGVSAFAQSRQGPTEYAELPSLPMASGSSDWFDDPGAARVLGKVRQDRTKLVAWLGYPVRLRLHQTDRWTGFFVEPLLLWKIELGDKGGDAPRVDEVPVINAKFLRAMSMGDNLQLAEESARLIEELGLDVPVADLPEADELVERLARIRPDWDWTESLEPYECTADLSLSRLSAAGIYNRAIVLPGERSPYTQGLETELKALAGVAESHLQGTALGRWLSGDMAVATLPQDSEPLIEVMPMNSEQRAAVRAGLSSPHTVVTGPPGTGKSQVVTNLLVNAAWRGMKVLFASKNNKAVDVVESRVNGLANRPILLRLGSKEYQERLVDHLTKLLAGNPGAEERASYEEGLGRHHSLTARMAELDHVQQQTLDARNTVDRLDAEIGEARQLFAELFAAIDEVAVRAADTDLASLKRAVDGADRERHGLLVRLSWFLSSSGRMRKLLAAVTDASESAKALGIEVPDPVDELDLPGLRKLMEEWSLRIGAARKVVAYKQMLEVLERGPSFEEIARQRYSLTEQVALNCQQLWLDWVQLAPTRMTAGQRKDVSDYAAALQMMTGPGAERVHASVRQRARALQSKVTELFACWAVTSLSARGRIPLDPGYFDLVVLDEASQCDIASALPLLYRAKRSVIIGDPQQLRHISALTRQRDSELQHRYGLVEGRMAWMYSVSSLYDVAASVVSQDSLINLRDHHRSHADIIEFSNRSFYEGRLRVATRYRNLKCPSDSGPGVVWQDVRGKVVRPSTGGAQNAQEAHALVDALEHLLVTQGFGGTVGVVTPFRAQAQLLQRLVQERQALDAVREASELLVDTVHRFQGDERDVMFFSTVVSAGTPVGALRFLQSNGNLFNVAITRARGLLQVVGDRAAASACGVEYLTNFAAYVQSLGVGAETNAMQAPQEPGPQFPRVSNPEQVSEWERVLYRALYEAGVRPIPQYTVEKYDLDFAVIIGERRLNIEVDGELYHRSWTGELCSRDQLRNQRLIELGWEVKRFWVYQLRDHLDECVDSIATWVRQAKMSP